MSHAHSHSGHHSAAAHAHGTPAHDGHAPHGHADESGHSGHDHRADDIGEILDLDAELLAEHTAALIDWLPLTAAPREIVDLGCGTGAGAFALLDRFPEARVTAVDSSAAHLAQLRSTACVRGIDHRVRTLQADLDAAAWPDLGAPDLVWASASMHHMADPARALRAVHDSLAPGGLFAVVELAGFPRFLPPDAPAQAPGLEERLHAATEGFHAEHVPHRGADWGTMLAAAGFTVEGERTLSVRIGHSPTVGCYALAGLARMRGTLAPELAPADLAALDRLLDPSAPDGILHRDDLTVRTERTVWAARRV
ncbi:methyltransferase [Streptomyces sp. NPDC060194]|uniref:class I SAM-dependent methyltransferase n=1 Tax=Streptomyces sp. NPDC060194 TaxID=3347069 RepID=UPI003666CFF0